MSCIYESNGILGEKKSHKIIWNKPNISILYSQDFYLIPNPSKHRNNYILDVTFSKI